MKAADGSDTGAGSDSLFQLFLARMGSGDLAGDASPGLAPIDLADPRTTPSARMYERLAARPPSGRYVPGEELARGGMGSIRRVWDEDLRRSLAMKLVLEQRGTSPAGAPSVARFLDEAQITGQLEHPGVVPVHELGVDEAGRAWFTMRLVRGQDLRRVLEMTRAGEEGWNLTRALGVLLRVCETLAYAHAKGVIHRDLKPGNVMVGRFGEVYVLDWGLARVVGRADAHELVPPHGGEPAEVRTERTVGREQTPDAVLSTRDGTALGTPVYMSPEQARGELERLDQRSDIYMLGAVLYELLAGRPPYFAGGADVSPHVVLRRVIEGPPEPLRAVAPDTPAELEAICDKAMARAPEERYPDALAMAADLRAWLEGRVVSAYETGALAEARKWVRRNQRFAASLLAGVLALAGGLAVSLWLLGEVRAERNDKAAALTAMGIAREAESAAHSQASQAEDFVAAFFTLAEARRAGPDSPPLPLELLDRAARLMEMHLRDAPSIRKDVAFWLGFSYLQAGQLEPARALLEEAMELAERAGFESEQQRADWLNALGGVWREARDLARAEDFFRRALDAYAAAGTPDPPIIVRNLVYALQGQGKAVEALRVLEDMLAQPGAESSLDAATLVLMGQAKEASGADPAEVRELYLLAIERAIAAEPASLELIGHWTTLAVFELGLKERERAAEALREAHALLESLGLQDHPAAARAWQASAGLASLRPDWYEVERCARLAVEIRSARLGPRHPDTAFSLADLGFSLVQLGRADEGEACYREVLDICAEVPDSPANRRMLAETHRRLGELTRGSGRHAEAAELYEEALEGYRTVLTADDPQVDSLLALLGAMHIEAGNAVAAEPVLRESLALRRRTLEPTHWKLASTQGLIGQSQMLQGEHEEAERTLLEAQRRLEAELPPEHARVRIGLEHLAELYERWGKPGRAAEFRARLAPPDD